MRAHHGLAWLPVFSDGGEIAWYANPNYLASTLGRRKARNYPELGLSTTLPIYESLRLHPESVQWVSDPERFTALWRDFQPWRDDCNKFPQSASGKFTPYGEPVNVRFA